MHVCRMHRVGDTAQACATQYVGMKYSYRGQTALVEKSGAHLFHKSR